MTLSEKGTPAGEFFFESSTSQVVVFFFFGSMTPFLFCRQKQNTKTVPSKVDGPCPYAPCMEYLPTCTINLSQMYASIAYM